MSTLRHFRRGSSDEGAAAVEFALLFPIFALLAFGTITAGTAFARQINVTQSVREASRYGSTYDISQVDGLNNGSAGSGTLAQRAAVWLSSVDTALTQTAGASNNPIGGYDYRCVALVTTDSTGAVVQNKTFYKADGGTATQASSNFGCPSVTAAAIKSTSYVQVVLSRNVQFFMIFATPTLHLDGVSTTPYEFTVS